MLGKPIPAAIFLTLNGVILYGGERLRRRAPASPGLPGAAGSAGTAIPASHAGRTRTAARQAARTDLASDRRLSALRFAEATLIGSAQVLAQLPGISRSGVTMVAGLTRGLSHEDAARFSFLLATPVILAAGVLKNP